MTDAPTESPTPAAPAGWNPLARREPQTFPLEVSGGVATATFRPWSARERLAYEDRTLELIGSDADGNATMLMGRLNALALTLTIVEWSGFPETVSRMVDGEKPGDDRRELVETLDLRKLSHVEELDPDTYAELVRHARSVQPLPGFDRGEDEEPGEQTPDELADAADEGELEDPSPTPSTEPDPTVVKVEPGPGAVE